MNKEQRNLAYRQIHVIAKKIDSIKKNRDDIFSDILGEIVCNLDEIGYKYDIRSFWDHGSLKKYNDDVLMIILNTLRAMEKDEEGSYATGSDVSWVF